RLETRDGPVGRRLGRSDGVTDLGVGDVLDRGREPADLSYTEAEAHLRLGVEEADVVDLERLARRDDLDLVLRLDRAVENPDEGYDALIGVVDRIEDERTQRAGRVALGWR